MRKSNRIISAVLAAVFCIAGVQDIGDPGTDILAAGAPAVWDGSESDDWYYESDDTVYHLSTAEDFAGFAKMVNNGTNFSGKTVVLDNDIYLNDVSDFDNWGTKAPANQAAMIGRYFFSTTGHYLNFDGIFDGGYGYSDRKTYERMVSFFQGRAALPYVLASRRPSDDILAFCEHPPIGIENIWIVTKDREARDALADHIRNTTKLHVMRTAERDVEAVHGSADKGMALEHLGMHLGISSEAIMAFGDNDNDKGMLKRAGIGVAMGNAPERIKGAADFVTGDNESEGVARFLEKYFNERDGVLWL